MPPSASLSSLVGVKPCASSASGSRDVSLSSSLWVPSGARGVFGGQVIAQSLVAASKTISPPLGLHSLHCYFLLPAHGSPDIEYRVERLRDGKSYANRLVRAWQGQREVFVLLASYTLPPVPLPTIKSIDALENPQAPDEEQSKVSHSLRFALPQRGDEPKPIKAGFQPTFQVPFPADLLPYEDCEAEEVRWSSFLEKRAQGWTRRQRSFLEEYIRERTESPVGISRALSRGHDKRAYPEVDPGTQQTRFSWLRARLGPQEKPDEETVKAMIAYMTDFQFIGTASRSVGLHQRSTPRLGMLASLDHSIHFYPFPADFDPAAPLLHVMESQSVNVGSGRGVVQGRVYTKDGVLVAVTAQEGVVRADLKGLEAKGLVEGGAVGEEEKETESKPRAKL